MPYIILYRTECLIKYSIEYYTVSVLLTLCGRRKEGAAVRVMTQQRRRKLTQQRRQNNYIAVAETITHKLIRYNK